MQQSAGNWPGLNAGDASPGSSPGFAAELYQQLGAKLSCFDDWLESLSNCPWSATAGGVAPSCRATRGQRPLYSAEERTRRDQTIWTPVQGVLAPIQFAVFMVSACLVLRYLVGGRGYEVATASVVAKTCLLYAIMITGSIWEKRVFGRYLFAPAFFWEDAVSMLVLALHSAYLAALIGDWGSPHDRMTLALAAYASYAVNATQFLLKLRAARLEAPMIGAGRGR